MNEPVLFSERQRFRQSWLWIILLALSPLLLFENIYGLIHAKDEASRLASFIPGLIIVAVAALIFFTQLDTEISKAGIRVRFPPIYPRYQMLAWDDISELSVRKYSPLTEYGGWGLRYGFGNGKAYTISGNMGIQLVLKNGRRLLIGTCRAEEVSEVLRSLNRNY